MNRNAWQRLPNHPGIFIVLKERNEQPDMKET
jgi:hypothetical protein